MSRQGRLSRSIAGRIGLANGPQVVRGGWAAAVVVLLSAVAVAAPPAVPEVLPGAEPFSTALRGRLTRALAARGPDYVPRTRHVTPAGAPLYSNRLLLESSTYLQQHAHNPVDWHPWGDEAFEIARRLGRPVLVSIGYSTCHWCHVMEEESFDDVQTAEILNAHFVAIKVDREARPDVDAVYMSAVRAMGEGGGWPLNVWLTPDRRPFHGGTYFPPTDQRGRPGFKRLLRAIHEQYTIDPEGLEKRGAAIAAHVSEVLAGGRAEASHAPDLDMLREAAEFYVTRADDEWGGLRQRIKFPSSVSIPFLLRWHRRSGETRALEIATRTLDRMAEGGIRDHLGGGFHRYSTDQRWLVPHFEKMLYDNAQLGAAYVEAWQATGEPRFAAIAREILRYVEEEMTAEDGGFYSATDADSADPQGELEEGRFFTWTPQEIDAVLGEDLAPIARAWYGVTPAGQLEGRSVLHTWVTPSALAERLELDAATLPEKIAQARVRLLEARAGRPPPLRDEKILASWNGLMVSAFARAGLAFGDAALVTHARRAADFVLTHMREDGRLHRVWHQGEAAGPAFLDDYAFLIAGLLDLYEAAPDPRWLREALALQAVLDARYADDEGGGYFRTADDAEQLLAREKPLQDGAEPSGNAVTARNQLRLTSFTGDESHRERALLSFSAFHRDLVASPGAHAEMLLAIGFELDTPKEVLIVRAPGDDAEALLQVLRRTHLPNRVLSVVEEGPDLEAHTAVVPLLKYKKAQRGRTTAYVCENRVCKLPTSDPATFEGLISARQSPE